MPMNFPDLESLKWAATAHNFRQPVDGESESTYRSALADHVRLIDVVESQEIRTSKGWNHWDNAENLALLLSMMR